MTYIEMPLAAKKLQRANREKLNVFINAPTGWGKSAFVKHHCKNKADYYTCENGKLELQKEGKDNHGLIVIDDLGFLSDENDRKKVEELLLKSESQIILLSRGDFPTWLNHILAKTELIRIYEKDLTFDAEQTAKVLKEYGVEQSLAEKVTKAAYGFPVAIKMYAEKLESGREFDKTLIAEVWESFYHYIEATVFNKCGRDAGSILLAMCVFDEFDEELAENILSQAELSKWLIHMRNIGHFLNKTDEEHYSIRPEFKKMLLWKRNQIYTAEQEKDEYRRAAAYYEKKNDVIKALEYYKKSDAVGAIERLLVRNANNHPGNGQYYELRKYYLDIPKENVLKTPLLIAAMSMLNSLLLKPEESEKWYSELKKFEKNPMNDSLLRKEARTRLVWLDIALPHRCGKGIIGLLKNAAILSMKKEINLPEFSVTSNLPSLMNGGIDFSDWSKIDKQLARFMSKPIETVLGKHGKGLVNIALAESGFEKGTMNVYEVLTRANNGYAAADGDGKAEICFAAVGVISKMHIVCGQLPTAIRQVESMRRRAENEDEIQLINNINAFETYIKMYENSREYAEKYLLTAPNENEGFYVLDRFRYMVKIRSLIAVGRLPEAFDLSCRMESYFELYARKYMWMENRVLQALILYRQGDKHWKEKFESALKRMEEYHFIRTVSMLGVAVIGMLEKSKSFTKISDKFYNELLSATKQIAVRYPEFMLYEENKEIELTEQEKRILGMLCSGMNLKDIAEELEIKYNSVKVHNHNIYQKLGVGSRAEAERVAVRLGIVRRGGEN